MDRIPNNLTKANITSSRQTRTSPYIYLCNLNLPNIHVHKYTQTSPIDNINIPHSQYLKNDQKQQHNTTVISTTVLLHPGNKQFRDHVSIIARLSNSQGFYNKPPSSTSTHSTFSAHGRHERKQETAVTINLRAVSCSPKEACCAAGKYNTFIHDVMMNVFFIFLVFFSGLCAFVEGTDKFILRVLKFTDE